MPRRRYSAVYTLWIAICATLFLLLSGAEDPSRRTDRVLSSDAGEIALRLLRERGSEYGDYAVVHIAYASKGEVGTEPRWVVLLDATKHTGLRKAVVVELRASDGGLVRIRKPV